MAVVIPPLATWPPADENAAPTAVMGPERSGHTHDRMLTASLTDLASFISSSAFSEGLDSPGTGTPPPSPTNSPGGRRR